MDVTTALVFLPTRLPTDRIVTSRVACVDSRESSPVPREASFHEEATTRRRSSRFRADFYRGYDGENLPSRPFEDFSRAPPINEAEN